jgi:hypothetical protein
LAKKAAASRARKTGSAKKGGAKKGSAKGARKRSTAKRERVDTGTNSMFGKRTTSGRFKEMDDVGRSQRVDRRKTAKKKTTSGFGDQGDQKRSTKKR